MIAQVSPTHPLRRCVSIFQKLSPFNMVVLSDVHSKISNGKRCLVGLGDQVNPPLPWTHVGRVQDKCAAPEPPSLRINLFRLSCVRLPSRRFLRLCRSGFLTAVPASHPPSESLSTLHLQFRRRYCSALKSLSLLSLLWVFIIQ